MHDAISYYLAQAHIANLRHRAQRDTLAHATPGQPALSRRVRPGSAPGSSAARVTPVRATPAFCAMTDPPSPAAPEASTTGVKAGRSRVRATASRTGAARPKRAAVSQPGPSHSSASLDSGTVDPQSSPAPVRAATA